MRRPRSTLDEKRDERAQAATHHFSLRPQAEHLFYRALLNIPLGVRRSRRGQRGSEGLNVPQ